MVEPSIAILLCTFNGEQFLKEQLDSIYAQTHQNWVLWVSDDGSTDQTLSILRSAQLEWGEDRVKIIKGPQKGFARNFLYLGCHPEIEADYFAFSDQDDIWLPEKLARALSLLEGAAKDQAALYGSRTKLINAKGEPIGVSKLEPHDLSFRNALVQNVAGGNTQVFNRALRDVLKFGGSYLDIVSHDWWVYIVATATNGKVVFDREPTTLYRQHKDNLVGANLSISAKLNRLGKLLSGRFKQWIEKNHSCIKKIKSKMSLDHVDIAYSLAELHQFGLVKRILRFKRIGVRRQTLLGTFALLIAVIIKQV